MKKQRRLAKKAERERAKLAAVNRAPAHAAPTRGASTMSRGEFYAWCKRTGQLALYFRLYPDG